MDRPGALTFYDAALSQDHLTFGTPIPINHGTTQAHSVALGHCSIRKRNSRRERRDSGSKFTRSAVSTITSSATGPPDNCYSTELNSINSPLLRLPAEIRTMIFTHVFRGQHYLFSKRHDYTITCGETFTQMDISLLVVSRQTYAETGMLPYELGTFDFHSRPGYASQFWRTSVRGFLKKRSMQQIEATVCVRAREFEWEGECWYQTGTGLYWARRLGV